MYKYITCDDIIVVIVGNLDSVNKLDTQVHKADNI